MPEQQISNEAIFGEFNDDGTVKRQARVTAIPEGVRVQAGDALVRIKGTKFFYYVQARVYSRITDEEFEKLEARVKPQSSLNSTVAYVPASKAVRPMTPVAKESDNDTTN